MGHVKGAFTRGFLNVDLGRARGLRPAGGLPSQGTSLGVTVWDLFYVGLTIVVFAVLLLILKGIESFER